MAFFLRCGKMRGDLLEGRQGGVAWWTTGMWVRPSGLGEMSFSGVLSRGPIGMMVDPLGPAELCRFSMLVKVASKKM